MLSTSPVWLSMRITSPTTKGRSTIRNRPLIRFEAEVCEAKPMATVRMPAAPRSTLSFSPRTFRQAIITIVPSE